MVRRAPNEKRKESALNFNIKVPPINISISGYADDAFKFKTFVSEKLYSDPSKVLRKELCKMINVEDLWKNPTIKRRYNEFVREFRRELHDIIRDNTKKTFSENMTDFIDKTLKDE
jgi:hypothetical protein